MKSIPVSLLILLLAIVLAGLVVANISAMNFLVYIVVVVPAICLVACLLLGGAYIFHLSQQAVNIVHYVIRGGLPLVLVAYALLFPEHQTIQKIPLKHGYSCTIYGKIFDDLSGGGLYYQFQKGRSVVVPMNLYAYGFRGNADEEYRFSAIYAADEAIIGILDISAFSQKSHQLIAIYDTRINESWDSHTYSEDPAFKSKWRSIFQQLQEENPGVPVPRDFSQKPRADMSFLKQPTWRETEEDGW
jgi:hypothetical protein